MKNKNRERFIVLFSFTDRIFQSDPQGEEEEGDEDLSPSFFELCAKQTQNPLPKVSGFSVNLDTMSGIINDYVRYEAVNYQLVGEEEEEQQQDYSYDKTIDLRELLGPDLALQENVLELYNVPLKTGSVSFV